MTPFSMSVASTAKVHEEELSKYVISAAKEVFSTMVMMELEDSFPLTEPVTRFKCSITGMVGLAGTYSGILSIHCPHQFALRITSNMLGIDIADAGEDVNDALGELANMLGGYVKQLLSKGGLDINLSIPTVISGEEYTVNFMSDSDCVSIPFSNDGERFLIGLKLRREGA